jgi:hypothetical protein
MYVLVSKKIIYQLQWYRFLKIQDEYLVANASLLIFNFIYIGIEQLYLQIVILLGGCLQCFRSVPYRYFFPDPRLNTDPDPKLIRIQGFYNQKMEKIYS